MSVQYLGPRRLPGGRLRGDGSRARDRGQDRRRRARRLGPARTHGRVRRRRALPGLPRQAAVLVVRLAKNHALPDGNKRRAWVLLRLFVELNGWAWDPHPSVDEAEAAVVAVASGEWQEEPMAVWLARHLRPPDERAGR